MKCTVLIIAFIFASIIATIIIASPLETTDIDYETELQLKKSALFWEEMPALDTVMKRIMEKVKKLTDGLQMLVERSIKAWQIFMGADSGTTGTEGSVTTEGEATEEYPA
ncbi:uncharacterized protein LOC143232210 [Tachypleus tridentatus]|uniref:uncharacterized protein LOC143232210 n=1 Tax=Tachypleus tridentatus TaxID=6853 RepID=UPI003FD236E4